MLDEDIRAALKRTLWERDWTAAIIEELPLLRGRGRADLAFVNGELCGYEIKSDVDSLVRLGSQAEHYQSVFEFITLVAARKHLKQARKRIPQCWGIVEAKAMDGQIVLRELRRPRRNHRIENAALARLLWKKECLRILPRLGITTRSQTPVRDLWKIMESLPSKVLCDQVRQALKLRIRIVGPPQIRDDDSRTTLAIESVPLGLQFRQ
jgi:hypothetical protein